MKNQISFGDAFSFGFNQAWNNLGLVVGSTALLTLVSAVFWAGAAAIWGVLMATGVLGSLFLASFVPAIAFALTGAFGFLLAEFLSMGFYLGYYRIMLDIKDTGTSTVGRLFSVLRLGLTAFFACLLFQIIVGLGTAFFIIPGLIFMGRFFFFPFFIIDKQVGIMDSLKMSWRATEGQTFNSMVFVFLFCLVCALGSIALGIGALFTIPVAFLAAAHVYRQLDVQAHI